jgi:uncharacterized membrane protein
VVLLTTFLASSVEAIEMVIIVLGVGATRGWRSALIGAATGFALLAVIVAILGAALASIPIGPLRVVVGALLLLFGLQWYRKGIARVAARGLAGMSEQDVQDSDVPLHGMDWVAFVLSFKGVLLEGLEIALIVVSFGLAAGQLGLSVVGAAAAVVVIGASGFALKGFVTRIPRSLLQLIVGTLLTSFGTFWSLEGLGVSWPQSDLDIVALLVVYGLAAATYIELERRRTHRARLEVVKVRMVFSGAVGVGRFLYRFIVGDDWTVAVVMLLALAATGVLVAHRISAWWLVPPLAIVTTGISLRRSGRQHEAAGHRLRR